MMLDGQGYSPEDFRTRWQEYADEFQFPTQGNQGGYLPMATTPWVHENRIPCRLLWNAITVTYEGRVSFCCIDFEDDMLVGDILTDDLLRIWESPQYAAIRRNHQLCDFSALPRCASCSSTRAHWAHFPTVYTRFDTASVPLQFNGAQA